MTIAPLKLIKRVAGACLYSGCHDQAVDGSDYCAPHDAHERGRDAAKKRRNRQRLADAGLCRDGCGRKVSKQKRANGTVMQRRCSTCKKAHRDPKRRVPGESRGVPGDGADPAKHERGWKVTLEQSPDGILRERSRYAGQGRRGRQSIEDLAEQNRLDAIDCIAQGFRALEIVRSPEVQSLPKIQRDEVLASALDHFRRASGWLDEIVDLHSPKSRKAEDRSEDE